MRKEEIHFQVIAALALKEGKEEAYALLDSLPPQTKESLKAVLDRFSSSASSDRLLETLQHHLMALRSQESFSGIAEIHPAWLVEALKKESPRVIGVILRHLPSKHVRYLLEQLPQRLVLRLPKLIEAFYVPPDLLHLIRSRFERHFVPMRISHHLNHSFEFQHLYYLKMEELECLFRELALSELALSLAGSSKKVLKMVLNRFGVQDAREILNRVKRFEEEPLWLLRDAKYSILELGGKETGADFFFRELGLQSLSKAFGPSDSFFFEALKQKLSPENAYLLKRFMEEHLQQFHPDWVAKRKSWILQHLLALSEQKKIDPLWSQYLRKEAA